MNFYGSLLFLSPLFPLIASMNICPISSCNTSNIEMKFPFVTAESSVYCFSPRFRLRCTKQGLTTVDLPYSGEFLIRNINYRTQEIQIYDPNSCLVKRLLSYNLSYSVFKSPYYVNLIFVTCPFTQVKYPVVDCLSNSTHTTLATTYLDLVTSLSCERIGMFMVPVSRPGPYFNDIVPYVVNNDILFTWDSPNCMECEERGGKCSFADYWQYQVVCSDDTGKHKAKKTATIVALCVALPAICFIIFRFLSLCFVQQPRDITTTEEIFTTQPPIAVPSGLDNSTIGSYPQVTLGESKRIPGSSDGTCVICLSDFCAKDIIRVIPECKHCFHTTCIDEWLRMKGTCPVCRNSPLP